MRSGWTRDQDEPNTASKRRLMLPHDVAQATPDAIAHDSRTDAARSDETSAPKFIVTSIKHAEDQ